MFNKLFSSVIQNDFNKKLISEIISNLDKNGNLDKRKFNHCINLINQLKLKPFEFDIKIEQFPNKNLFNFNSFANQFQNEYYYLDDFLPSKNIVTLVFNGVKFEICYNIVLHLNGLDSDSDNHTPISNKIESIKITNIA